MDFFFNAKFRIVIIIVLLIFSLNFFQKEVRNFFYFVSSPVQNFFWETGSNASGLLGRLAEVGNLTRNNKMLELENQILLLENTALKELKTENKNLREFLNIGLREEFDLLDGKIVGKDPSRDSILVDRGSKDGISQGLSVITPQKVVLGQVEEVYKDFSVVSLLSNKKSNFDVKIVAQDGAEEKTRGAVKGEGGFKMMLNLIPQEAAIEEGDLILTTGSASLNQSAQELIYPYGLLVGSVKNIIEDDFIPFKKAEIQPLFDIQKTNLVFFILKF